MVRRETATLETDNGATNFDVAIVGGGFSGLCTAWRLLTHEDLPARFRCAIIEPNERLGAGLAYRTDCPQHLLNVRAKGMSITENDPASFATWLARSAPEFSPDDFVPRGVYRRYINDCLEQASSARPGMLSVIRDEARALRLPSSTTGGYLLKLASGRAIRAGSVVLALGNLPPSTQLGNGLLRSPWNQGSSYQRLKTLAIVGAGLTALDVILEAEHHGFSGRYRVISPHGAFPKAHHEPHTKVPSEIHTWAAELTAGNPALHTALRAFQRMRKSGVNWEHLVDALRKHSPAIWSGFNRRDKCRFLRLLRTNWNIHLHRSCRKTMQVIAGLIESGRLEQIAARVTGVEPLEGDSAVRLLFQDGTSPWIDVDMAINGTGLFTDIQRTDSPLVAQLIEDRIVQPDEFRFGFKVNGAGQLLSPCGEVQPRLFTLGALRRGEELECTAVPEIRRQVGRMVEEIIGMMG